MAGNNIIVAASVSPQIIRSAYLPITTEAAQYTVPADTSVKIATASVTNVTGGSVNVTLSLVPAGGSLDGTHRVLNTFSLPANDTLDLTWLRGAMLGPGDFIGGLAGTANAIVLTVTGTVHS
jgi:hypothetical protein